MKKSGILFLVIVMCVSLLGCSGNKKAFTVSEAAYDKITTAYEIADNFGTDIYEAWRLGINDRDEILDNGIEHLASELSLSEDELREGVVYALVVSIMGADWNETPEDSKQEYRELADTVFNFMEDDLFSFCVYVVTGAYTVNGKIAEAEVALDEAKTLMKELSEKFSDYEHYPNLKEYYTTTSSFFDFCKEPTGSFEQLKETINDYKNEARDLINDLNYIFEE